MTHLDDLYRRLTDPIFKDVTLKLCERYSEEWRTTGPAQAEAREALYQKQLVLVDVVQEIHDMYTNAKAGSAPMTEQQLDLALRQENGAALP